MVVMYTLCREGKYSEVLEIYCTICRQWYVLCITYVLLALLDLLFVALSNLRGGGYFRTFWVGMCRWDSGTLSLYQNALWLQSLFLLISCSIDRQFKLILLDVMCLPNLVNAHLL